jgi:hypothetical protein
MATYYVASYGSNTNNGTSPSTPWLSLTFALGAASGTNPGMTAGDTLWIAPGVYRETAGVTYNGGNGTSGNTINIYGDPTFSRTWTSGSVGPVRLTTASSDNAICASNTSALVINKEYVTIQDVCFDANPPNSLGFGQTGVLGIGVSASNITVTRCVFQTDQANSGNRFFCIGPNIGNGKSNFTFDKCVFLFGGAIYCAINTQSTTPHNVNIIIKDCIHIGTEGYTFFAQTAGQANGISIFNCTSVCSSNCIYIEALATNAGTIIRNCNFTALRSAICIYSTSTAMQSEDYNRLSGTTIRTNVTGGTNTINAQTVLDKDSGLIQGYGTFAFASAIQGFGSIGAGVVSGAPTSDIYGVTWLGNPSVGAVESKARGTGSYQPTERNASTITIAPGSTSQSIELYLGATGLTFSTSGLAAYYVRNQSAPVAITLVTQTPTGAWTSGGFAEISSSLVPGVYRLDVPNAAFAAGASDVTIVVRGASGTNGAVLTVTLSSGGLTAAQTAAAVWDASRSAYATAGTFGEYVNVNVNSGAIADAVWDEARSGHTTVGTFGQYVNAELVTPVTSAALVRMGPFEVRADGLGASDPLDIQKGAQHGVDIQCVDNNGSGIDITSATVTAKVYNSGATLVDTYACTATYAADGRATFTIDTTVTNTPGTYTATITRTTGASDTQIFGPLRIYVRDI